MSDQPSTSGEPPVQQPSRTVRRRRPTAIPIEEPQNAIGEGGSEVKILRPSDVPQREPLPEYNPPNEQRNIVPKTVPIDRLHEFDLDNTRNVTLPSDINSEILIQEAERIKEPVSFRSTNYVEPDQVLREMEEYERNKSKEEEEQRMEKEKKELGYFGKEEQIDFLRRSKRTIDSVFYGCSTRTVNDSVSSLHIIMNGPEGSIYEGGVYFVTIFLYVDSYKNLIPSISFNTMMFNPNIAKNGVYDNRNLLKNWNKNSTLEDLLKWLVMEIVNLKTDISSKSPEQIEMMPNPPVARIAYNNWERFEETAREMVMKMAGGKVAKHRTVTANMGDVYTDEHGWAVPEVDKKDDDDDDAVIDVCN